MAYSDRELLARIVQCEAGGEGDNGMKAVDDVEIKGLTAVFGDKLAEKPVVELKEVLGESRAAAATTAVAHAALMFAGDTESYSGDGWNPAGTS